MGEGMICGVTPGVGLGVGLGVVLTPAFSPSVSFASELSPPNHDFQFAPIINPVASKRATARLISRTRLPLRFSFEGAPVVSGL